MKRRGSAFKLDVMLLRALVGSETEILITILNDDDEMGSA